MRVRITAKAVYRNPRRGLELEPGSVHELDDGLAVKLLTAGLAAPAPAPVETPTVAPLENAAKRTGKPPARKAVK